MSAPSPLVRKPSALTLPVVLAAVALVNKGVSARRLIGPALVLVTAANPWLTAPGRRRPHHVGGRYTRDLQSLKAPVDAV